MTKEKIMTKANNISSDYRANSFCCVLNNVDKLFDKKSDFFDNDNFKPKTRKRIQEFRKLLPDTDVPLHLSHKPHHNLTDLQHRSP